MLSRQMLCLRLWRDRDATSPASSAPLRGSSVRKRRRDSVRLRTNSEAGLRYGRPINAREPLASTGDLRLSPLSLAIVSLGQPKTRLNPIFQLVDLFAPGAFATASS